MIAVRRTPKRFFYSLLGLAVLCSAGFMIYRALAASVVYFILPSEYAAEPGRYGDRKLRLGGLVKSGTVAYNADALDLSFDVTDSSQSYPVRYSGAPPELFKVNTGVVLEGAFAEGGVFVSQTVLVKHSEEYRPVQGDAVDDQALKEALY